MMIRILLFILSITSILTRGQNAEKINFTKQLNRLKTFDNLIVNDSLNLIAELKGYNPKTKTYSQCYILIPHERQNNIEIKTELPAYTNFISYTTEKHRDTLVINYWYPIMTDTSGAYDIKIVKKEYLISVSGKLKKTIELKSYPLSNPAFLNWYDNHITKALALKSVKDLNILFTIINSKSKSNDFFLNNSYQDFIKGFNVDYYAIRSLLWTE